MADKGGKLEAFKIGDTQKPTVARRSPAKPIKEEPESRSLGFGRIERMLENETPESVSSALNHMLGALHELEAKGGMKEKAAAKKAMIAVERTADLMDYLFQTKVALESPGNKG